MGNCNNCCNNNERKDEIITDKVKVTIIKDFNMIVTTLNPFYFYNYSIIEDIEKRFTENELILNDFIDVCESLHVVFFCSIFFLVWLFLWY